MTSPGYQFRDLRLVAAIGALATFAVSCEGGATAESGASESTVAPAVDIAPLSVEGPAVGSSPLDARGAFSVTDANGYTYDVEFHGGLGAAVADGYDQLPGETKVVVPFQVSVTTTSTTEGHQAPPSPGASDFALAPLWPEGSPVCETPGISYGVDFAATSPRAYCLVRTPAPFFSESPGPLAPGASVDTAISDSLVYEGVDEAAGQALVAAFQAGPEGWVAGYGGAVVQVESSCSANTVNVLWKSAALQLPDCPVPTSADTSGEVAPDLRVQAAESVRAIGEANPPETGTVELPDCPAGPRSSLTAGLPPVELGDEDGRVDEWDGVIEVSCGAQSPLFLTFTPLAQDQEVQLDRFLAERVESFGGTVAASEEFPLHGGSASVYCQDGVWESNFCFGLWHDEHMLVEASIGTSEMRGDPQLPMDWMAQNLGTALTNLAHYGA